MKERATLATAVAAIVLIAFARCERPRVEPAQAQEVESRDLPAGAPDQFSVTPRTETPIEVPQSKQPETVVTVPYEQLPIPARPDREMIHHHILFGDIDNPHADEDMVIKPPGNRTWPMPVLPHVK